MDAQPIIRADSETESRVVRRAASAYLAGDEVGRWPDEVESGVERHGGLNYVCLRDARGTLLAVYRLRRDRDDRPGQLKRLKRWPWDEAVEDSTTRKGGR